MPTPSNRHQPTLTKTLPAHFVEPVVALRLVPHARVYQLDSFKYKDKPAPHISIGRAPHVDIAVDDPYVSRVHCIIWRDGLRLYAQAWGSKNALLVNGAVVRTGTVELLCGSVLHVGCSAIIACSEQASSQDISIVAPNLDQFIKNAVRFYGSKPKAASKLGVAVSTFYDWIAGNRFGKKQGE